MGWDGLGSLSDGGRAVVKEAEVGRAELSWTGVEVDCGGLGWRWIVVDWGGGGLWWDGWG